MARRQSTTESTEPTTSAPPEAPPEQDTSPPPSPDRLLAAAKRSLAALEAHNHEHRDPELVQELRRAILELEVPPVHHAVA